MFDVADVMEPILTVTDEARAKILAVREGETEPETLALRVAVNGVSDGAFTYDMSLEPLADASPDDAVQRHDDLSVVIAADSIDKLVGATLDFAGAGMVMNNPNRPAPAPAMPARPEADLSGELPQRVIAVLDEQINPAIAAHGGFAELVAVEETVAYLRMGGGCQGCGMAAVTLSQGIEVAILEAVPEIEKVVDVTDHASGANPYFESAKK
jgi:Fe/S biogenesis protein NfuA